MKWWEDSVGKHEEALQGQPIQDPSKGVANTGQCTAHGSYRQGVWTPTQTLYTRCTNAASSQMRSAYCHKQKCCSCSK